MSETTIAEASKIEQWSYFLLYADQSTPERLRELLPGVEFQQAITVIEVIAAKTEDRVMYDHREKAQRDEQWHQRALQVAREEGREEGRTQGVLERGAVVGKIQLLQQLLGVEVSSMADLSDLPMTDLSTKLADVQQRYVSRGD